MPEQYANVPSALHSTIITAIKVSRQIFSRMKAYIEYRIALCLHLEIYLLLSILILNEVIRVDLIVFLALFADVATIAIAYDNAQYAQRPVEWQLPKIWIISSILGVLLAAGTWILRGTLFLNGGGVIENFGNPQGILFLEVALTENWLIFVTRVQGGFTWPSFQLVGAILAVDALATLFCLFGWLCGGGRGSEDIWPDGGPHHEHWVSDAFPAIPQRLIAAHG
jgi:H+-transporting ATPase